MHAQLQASMGHELYNACIAGNLDAVKVSLADSKAADSSFSPPVSTILHGPASKDHVKIVKYCLENGATVNRDVVLIVLINRPRETYIHLLESKAVDINHYISWFGDILSNVATRDDLTGPNSVWIVARIQIEIPWTITKLFWPAWQSLPQSKWRHCSFDTARTSKVAGRSSWPPRRASWTW
jgi:hypothetical protein